MFTSTLSGTRAEITHKLSTLKLPPEVRAGDALCEYVLAHIPQLMDGRYTLVLSVQCITNANHSTVAGHVSVVITQQ
jgi:hypothetical protein